MPDLSLESLPEVFISDSEMTDLVYRAAKAKKVKKLAAKLYTKNLLDPPELIVRQNLWPIVAKLYPGAIVSERTAFEMGPASDGSLFIISPKRAKTVLPGVRIFPRTGAQALASDRPFIDGLLLASPARIYLENLRFTRASAGHVARGLSRKEIEERLELLLQGQGEGALNSLRDEARAIADSLKLENELEILHKLVGTLLGTKTSKLDSAVGAARARGEPYDPARLVLFETLLRELHKLAPTSRRQISPPGETLPFFEAYFSNFIEGTEFEVEDAKKIVFDGIIPKDRPDDAHDVRGTFKIVSSRNEMSTLPRSFELFVELLKRRHADIMAARTDKLPGEFKHVANRAGSTSFVKPELVIGTLKQGFQFYQSLREPFHRAVFMMFLVSEVHPFADGNGRCARIFMNAELVANDEARIIIPIVYRTNYVQALKALSLNGLPEPIIRTLDFAQRLCHAIDWTGYDAARTMLETSNAFIDPADADRQGLRLRLPEA